MSIGAPLVVVVVISSHPPAFPHILTSSLAPSLLTPSLPDTYPIPYGRWHFHCTRKTHKTTGNGNDARVDYMKNSWLRDFPHLRPMGILRPGRAEASHKRDTDLDSLVTYSRPCTISNGTALFSNMTRRAAQPPVPGARMKNWRTCEVE